VFASRSKYNGLFREKIYEDEDLSEEELKKKVT